jgi:hypothetical protein
MVAANPNLNKGSIEVTEKVQWTLKEIRDAYGEILRAYNALFPLHPQTRMEHEDIIIDTVDSHRGDDDFHATFQAKAREILPKLKKAADQSGNAVTWHRGEPLESLNEGMRERIERALKFGI